MNIQIFGKNKSFDTKKAERFFKERGIKYQYIDLPRYGMSMGEYRSVKQAVGSVDALIDAGSKAYEARHIAYLAYKEDVEAALLEEPEMFAAPIVRNGRKATVGYQPEVWKAWIENDK